MENKPEGEGNFKSLGEESVQRDFRWEKMVRKNQQLTNAIVQ